VTETNRLEAFSDGVMAIAITLLVLDLSVPARSQLGRNETLRHALAQMWPNYAAYVVSFLIIGIIWMNHHSLFRMIARVDRLTLFLNLLLLMVVSAIPFPTRLLAEYLTAGGPDSHLAAAVYSGTMLAMSLAFGALFVSATRRPDLLRPAVDHAVVRASIPRFTGGGAVYALTVVLAFISAPVTLLAHFGLAVYYLFDHTGSDSSDSADSSDPASTPPPELTVQ